MTSLTPDAARMRLDAGTSMECRICWHVYDPAAGDPGQQIAAGTAFLDLPDHWRCPECDSGPDAFLPLGS